MAAVLVCAVVAGCSLTSGEKPGESASVEKGPSYEVAIVGLDDAGDLKDRLTAVSRLESLKGEPPVTDAGLRRRMTEDVERFESVLRSEGYYGAVLEPRIESGEPIEVAIAVSPGPRYRLTSFAIRYEGVAEAEAAFLPGGMADVGLEAEGPARSDAVVAAEARLLEALARKGRPLAAVKDRKVVVDHAKTTMSVDLQVDPGPAARFGSLRVEGLSDVREAYIRRLVPWDENAVYDQEKVAKLTERLYDTALFQSATVRHADAVAADGGLAMTIEVSEAKPRTIGAGVNFSTDEGPGAKLFWEHRNLFGEGERVELTAEGSMIRQRLRADFVNPDFRSLDQDLLFTGELARQDSDAYRSRTLSLFSGIRREFSEVWSGEAGGSFEFGVIDDRSRDDDRRSTFTLLGLPLKLKRDTRDNILDPTRGASLVFGLTPYANVTDGAGSFLDVSVTGAAYAALDDGDRYVAALRGRLETLVGTNTRAIPATKRLYAGGGGSVRGYEFQSVGPLDAENDPVGGRSLAEVGGEVRVRLGESFGIVPFIDGGLVNDPSVPDFDQNVFWAAGLGFRYYTAVGPLRADIAFPLKRREGVDDLFQIYLSLGQSF